MATSPRRISAVESSPSSESGSSSTSEEERLRRLFLSCDADGDGLLDRNDFAYMCRELNMEDLTQVIMHQLGMTPTAKISFADFIRYRTQVMRDTDNPPLLTDDTGIDADIMKQAMNITSWPTMSSDSLGAMSARPDSLDYDSGARDLQSPEPPISLQKIIESHDPHILRHVRESCIEAPEFLGLADRLHLAAQTSLKGEIIELRSHLQHTSLERDKLEKQVAKFHTEQCRLQEDFEDRIEELTFRYEERITELHSVIAELRKKIERHQINVIREEDEDEVDPAVSTKSQDGGSINENNTIGSQTHTQDGGGDLNSELSRVVTELETAIHERRRNTEDVVDNASEEVLGGEDDSVEEKALQVCKNMEDFSFDSSPPPPPPRGLRPATFHPPPPPPPNEFPDPGYLQEEITALRTENSTLQEQIVKQEVELQRHRLALSNMTEERNRFKKQVYDHQGRHHSYEGSGSPHTSRTSTPTKSQHAAAAQAAERAVPTATVDQFPVAKVAELKKLKTVNSERQVLGSEISSIGMPTTKVAEHLVAGLWEGSKMQEIVSAADQSGSSILDSKVPEFEIELERLQSQIDNLRSQNDVTNLTLEESKAQCDRLTILIGKYESNVTALQIVLNYSDQCMELFEILCALLESEQGLVLANCRAAGLGSMGNYQDDQGEITSILQRAHHSRRAAENVAKHMLHKLDKSFGIVTDRSSSSQPWDDLSSSAGKTASSSSSAGDTDFTKTDERRLRDYIHQLKSERDNVKLTVMELESVHTDPLSDRVWKSPDAQRLDLENAVIIQELMAMKEEKADLKAQNYLLEKEKRALELSLSGKESQEQAYLAQIEHLKSEVTDQSQGSDKEDSDTSTPAITLAELRSHDPSEVARDLASALKREKKLKSRVQDLVSALEKLSRNSEIRHQQSAEFVNDLKRANSALISAFDKAKKKYQSKLKKLESQMQSLTERYETQIRMLKQRITRQEEEKQRPTNETSL